MTLKSIKDAQRKPNRHVVAALKKLLALAESGQITSLAFVYESRDGALTMQNVIEMVAGNVMAFIGALDMLKLEIVDSVLREADRLDGLE